MIGIVYGHTDICGPIIAVPGTKINMTTARLEVETRD